MQKLLGSTVLAAAFCGAGGMALGAECGAVTLAVHNVQSAEVLTFVDKFILEHGYGCTVETVPGDTVPTTTSMVEKGDPDVSSETWVNLLPEVLPRGLAEGKIIFLSPVLDPETRSARAVAEIPNAEGNWRAGGFATAHLATAEQAVDVLVPRDAVQEVEGKKVVFVRNEEGFELREVETGREDANGYEVIFGLDQGTEIAVANAFSLRAELSKSEAGHAH